MLVKELKDEDLKRELYQNFEKCDVCERTEIKGHRIPHLSITEKSYCDECLDIDLETDKSDLYVLNFKEEEAFFKLSESKEIKELFESIKIEKEKEEFKTKLKFDKVDDECFNCCEKKENMNVFPYIKLIKLNSCKECFKNYPAEKAYISVYGQNIIEHNLSMVNDIEKCFF